MHKTTNIGNVNISNRFGDLLIVKLFKHLNFNSVFNIKRKNCKLEIMNKMGFESHYSKRTEKIVFRYLPEVSRKDTTKNCSGLGHKRRTSKILNSVLFWSTIRYSYIVKVPNNFITKNFENNIRNTFMIELY